MSEGRDIPLQQAQANATTFLGLIRDYCQRVEIAGSVRRMKPAVHDIEIVAIPSYSTSQDRLDFFTGEESPQSQKNLLHERLEHLLRAGTIDRDRPRRDNKKNPFGKKYYRINYHYSDRHIVPVDLFVANPENWGLIYLIRTGSAEFSKFMAETALKKGYRFKDGFLTQERSPGAFITIPTPREQDVFDYLDEPYINPTERGYHI